MSTTAQPDARPPIEVSVVIPCLNEETTVGRCVRKALDCFRSLGIAGEVVVADNGSTDRSAAVAAEEGARVVQGSRRGYGNALRSGFDAAQGRYIIMGDADLSYDFGDLGRFVQNLREGYDLVMGSRFRGSIEPHAMPWHHRYVGNPVLSFLVRRMFHTGVSDCHCGMRGFSREAYKRMALRTGGMEFASEMVINSAAAGLRIAEVPITLHRDGRAGASHLHSFRDGWRHLRLMLLLSPFYLFLLPAAAILAGGLFFLVCPVFLNVVVLGHRLQTHFVILGNLLVLIAFQVAWLGVFAHAVSLQVGPFRTSRLARAFFERFTLERAIAVGLAFLVGGAALGGKILLDWVHSGFADLNRLDPAILSSTLMLIGLQVLFSGFFLSLVQLRQSSD